MLHRIASLTVVLILMGSAFQAQAADLCVTAPLPATVPDDASQEIWERDGNRFAVSVWRVECDAENSNLLMRVEPRDGDAPRICTDVIGVLQGNRDFSNVVSLKVSPDNREFCNSVSTPATFLVEINGSGLNQEGAFRLTYENGLFENPNKQLSVLAFTPTGSGGAVNQISPGHTGTWYNSDRDGEGYVIEVADNNGTPTLIAYYYTYDQGRQMYLLGAKSFNIGDTQVTVPLKVTSGASFGFAFNPAHVFRKDWGSLKISFDSCDTGSITYTSGLTQDTATIPITRLTKIKDLACP